MLYQVVGRDFEASMCMAWVDMPRCTQDHAKYEGDPSHWGAGVWWPEDDIIYHIYIYDIFRYIYDMHAYH